MVTTRDQMGISPKRGFGLTNFILGLDSFWTSLKCWFSMFFGAKISKKSKSPKKMDSLDKGVVGRLVENADRLHFY